VERGGWGTPVSGGRRSLEWGQDERARGPGPRHARSPGRHVDGTPARRGRPKLALLMLESARRFTRFLPKSALLALLVPALYRVRSGARGGQRRARRDARAAACGGAPRARRRVTVTGLPESHSIHPGRPLPPATAPCWAPTRARPTHALAANGGGGEGARWPSPASPCSAMDAKTAAGPAARRGSGRGHRRRPGQRRRSNSAAWLPRTPDGDAEVRLFHDAASRRLSALLTPTVRVDFNRPAAATAMRKGAGEPDRNVTPRRDQRAQLAAGPELARGAGAAVLVRARSPCSPAGHTTQRWRSTRPSPRCA
jgi:hypothetical protein